MTRMECRHGDEVVSRAYAGGHIVDESNARSVEENRDTMSSQEPSVLSRFCPCYSIDRIERAQVHSDLDDYIQSRKLSIPNEELADDYSYELSNYTAMEIMKWRANMLNSYPHTILNQEILLFKIPCRATYLLFKIPCRATRYYENNDQYLESLRLGRYGKCYSCMSVLPVGQISACCS